MSKSKTPVEVTKTHNLISLGAGTQSTLLYLLADKGELTYLHKEWEEVDVGGTPVKKVVSKEWRDVEIERCVFADTGEEPGPVMDHLAWLMDNHDLPIDIVSAGTKGLGHDLINGTNSTGQPFASIPAFTIGEDEKAAGGRPGMLRRQCTSEYKLTPIRKWVRGKIVGLKKRQHFPKHVRVRSFIGMSADEVGRAMRVMSNADWWELPTFPLIDMGFDRQRTIRELETNFDIPHEVPRSACTFCPFRGDDEWIELLKTDPEGFQRAVDIDLAIRHHDSKCHKKLIKDMYIHRSCVPLGEIDFAAIEASILANPKQLELFSRPTCMGVCGT